MPAVMADRRLRYIHHDWADAAERTQQTVRNLSEQLRRFLEDKAWIENRRVLDLVRTVEQAALRVRSNPPDLFLTIDLPGLPINLPFERPLHSSRPPARVDSLIAPAEVEGYAYLNTSAPDEGEEGKLVLERDAITEMLRLFLPDSTDEVRIVKRVHASITQVVKLGFLEELRGAHQPSWEVKRIIKAYVDAETMADFASKLAAYAAVEVDDE